MKIAVINGPNLNLLGLREPHLYGYQTYNGLCQLLQEEAKKKGLDLEIYQSNHEGALVDYIQGLYQKADGIIINPAAYTHTSIAILDALKAINLPVIEVHLTDISQREDYRKHSYVSEVAFKTITGKGSQGYLLALEDLIREIKGYETDL